jgi:hypothetical protein
MDYSASIHEDNPADDQNVWGSSSPVSSPQQRTRVGTLGSDPPQSPFQSAYSQEQQQQQEQQHGTEQQQRALEPDGFLEQTGFQPEAGERQDDSQNGPPQQQQSHHHHGQDAARKANSPALNQPPPPAAQQQRQHPQTTAAPKQASQQPRRPQQPQHRLQAKITGLERTGKKDPILRFDVHTNLPRFRTTQFRDVRRFHSEFVKLAEHLISANSDAIVHAVPPPLTSAGAGTDEDELRVKALMQRWFNSVCSNETLMRDEEMVLFVESDFGYSPMVKMKQPATGVRRKILKQFAPPPDDTPELAAARPTVKLFYLGSMDAGHKVDKLVKTRRGKRGGERERCRVEEGSCRSLCSSTNGLCIGLIPPLPSPQRPKTGSHSLHSPLQRLCLSRPRSPLSLPLQSRR